VPMPREHHHAIVSADNIDITDLRVHLDTRIALAIDGLVDLEMGVIRLPEALDLQVTTSVGDIEVDGLRGRVEVDAEVGDINVVGADDGMVVFAGHGHVAAEVAGPSDIVSRWGSVDVVQTAAAEDVVVYADEGDVHVVVASDTNATYDIFAGGELSIRTDNVAADREGEYRRVLGNGTMLVQIVAERGDVTIRVREPAAAGGG